MTANEALLGLAAICIPALAGWVLSVQAKTAENKAAWKQSAEIRERIVNEYDHRVSLLEECAEANRSAVMDIRNFMAENRVKLEHFNTAIGKMESILERHERLLAKIEHGLNGGLKHVG